MKAWYLLCTALAAAGVPFLVATRQHPDEPLQHVSNTFTFTASGRYAAVFPLFGADKERVWSEGWAPDFLFPNPARDTAGMVFTVAHSHTVKAVWVNTVFDAASGHVQYVYVLPDVMAAMIDIHVSNDGGNSTAVRVTYERTALAPAGNDRVRQMGEHDKGGGPIWAAAIGKYLQSQGPSH